ncbi:MAG TPA: DUF4880 domain-containing protein [Methylibium sp.]|uniref:FecR/PupR family sigma factor regulator n=1 Tax=Methylibium sp. TaxID=2067992 RepID=UPI002DBF70B0|nr:DUF4880 domain-containing protein [Methylibium sp.]HEU4460555.1 DUF4880 domain-containing protein [Methylibium sp.]
MADEPTNEAIEQEAIGWVMALHDAPPNDPALREALAQWLARGPAQRAAYAEARRVWLLTGLLPPADRADDLPQAPATSPQRLP